MVACSASTRAYPHQLLTSLLTHSQQAEQDSGAWPSSRLGDMQRTLRRETAPDGRLDHASTQRHLTGLPLRTPPPKPRLGHPRIPHLVPQPPRRVPTPTQPLPRGTDQTRPLIRIRIDVRSRGGNVLLGGNCDRQTSAMDGSDAPGMREREDDGVDAGIAGRGV